MAYAPNISSEKRDEIIAAKHAGERTRTIAERLGVGEGTVHRVWFRHRYPDRKAVRAVPPPPPEPVVRPDVVVGLHGVSLPRLRCMEDA